MIAMRRTIDRNTARRAEFAANARARGFGYHAQLDLQARHDADGVWRWIGVRPGDELLTERQISELTPIRLAG